MTVAGITAVALTIGLLCALIVFTAVGMDGPDE